jgi:hypothetical protein
VITEAHMFWWHYKSPYRVENSSEPWPIILWLQGGPVSILFELNFEQEQFKFLFHCGLKSQILTELNRVVQELDLEILKRLVLLMSI